MLYLSSQLLSITSIMSSNNGPILVRGNLFVNNTAPSEAASLVSFDMQGESTAPHVIDHNVWVDNALVGPATDLGRPHDRAAVAAVVKLTLLHTRQANITFVNNVLRNPSARTELHLRAYYDSGQSGCDNHYSHESHTTCVTYHESHATRVTERDMSCKPFPPRFQLGFLSAASSHHPALAMACRYAEPACSDEHQRQRMGR